MLLRSGVEEKTGEVVPSASLAQRAGWCSDLVTGMVTRVLAGHWNFADVARLASGVDAAGQAAAVKCVDGVASTGLGRRSGAGRQGQ